MSRDERLKRLLYQSIHRGCKETDALLGKFAKKYLETFSAEEVDLYEKFISQDDWDIYAWITGAKDFPKEHENKVTKMLREFDFVKGE
ncbi:MAG: succinate dehydrogenase assembly factor 2 [Rickettsiales bacterium]|nr:succinate dehydrogenase assembly factor 2 [Pseudomonadota bacterium]MDA0966818.1 succinate dehydrogenase assembly factor 2 [Pseudomonadota bacterium]MDG4543492.1 succinate dehydrogenase assembly factor 2 [Rickettsiales bacterium]MDG4546114.1 succinate dehydrogenase assembly factor 2 [Rickettsiales bacterium]MDG4547587.1 succinate dehydrogenase assembly factor 2 [Rickettsiales bacterium]